MIDHRRLMQWPIADMRQAYGKKDVILYALGVGLGADPVDPAELKFVYEDGLVALPSMACVLAYPGLWARDPRLGLDWRRMVHAEQTFELGRPLAAEGALTSASRVTGLYDRGPGRGALLRQERMIRDEASGEPIARVEQIALCRADGGFGGPADDRPRIPEPPDRAADMVCDLMTLPQAALIYRLSGDDNPLHADPAAARAVGYDRPILHGLCTLGVICHAIIRAMLGYDPARLTGMRARFNAPVFPGETIRTEMWRADGTVLFRAFAAERGAAVVRHGCATIDAFAALA